MVQNELQEFLNYNLYVKWRFEINDSDNRLCMVYDVNHLIKYFFRESFEYDLNDLYIKDTSDITLNEDVQNNSYILKVIGFYKNEYFEIILKPEPEPLGMNQKQIFEHINLNKQKRLESGDLK